jgi:cytochrome P450
VAYDHEHFTSRSVVVSERRPGPDDLPAPIGLSPPITSDPPYHSIVRRMLLPAFTPKPIAALEPFPAANRDPAAFEHPDLVQLDRARNRHAAFGLGRHRCLGSNLARMELRVALQEWLARYPDFELSDPAAVTWSAGQVRGPRALPVTIRQNGR